MSIWDKWRPKENVGKYAWAILFAVLKEMGEVALTEFGAALEQYRKERKTPDGWTEEEYLTYAIGRLKVIQAQQQGPWLVDEVVDYCIEQIIGVLEGKLENLDAEPEPEPEPWPAPDPQPVPVPVPHPPAPDPVPVPVPVPVPPPAPKPEPKDPYYPTKYGPMDEIPRHRLYAGDQVWKEGLNRFIIPRLFTELPIYRQATNNATLIEVINDSGVDAK